MRRFRSACWASPSKLRRNLPSLLFPPLLLRALFLLVVLLPGTAAADGDWYGRPVIAIIIDDLGNHWSRDLRAVELPGPVACSFLPHTRYSTQLAELAHKHKKEVMLHLPMESMEHDKLDAGGLTLDMTQSQLLETFATSLAAIPWVTGVNNHMGSLLTRHPGHMKWLMEAIQANGNLFFVDSRTTRSTVAQKVAAESGVPNIERNVFLDSVRGVDNVEHQFRELLNRAYRRGMALAIGHPYPETLYVLEKELRLLERHGVQLVPVAQLIEDREPQNRTWRASLSH